LARAGIPAEVFEMDAELKQCKSAPAPFTPKRWRCSKSGGWWMKSFSHGYKWIACNIGNAPRRLIADFDYSAIAQDTPYPYRLQCPAAYRHPCAEARPRSDCHGKVHMGHKLLDFTDHGTHVTARFETPSGLVEREGSYIIGADGTHSAVRKQLNIGFQGKTYEDRFLLIGSDLQTGDLLPGAAQVCYIFDPQEWVIILNLPDIVRVVFRMTDDENEEIAMREENLRARIRNFFGETSRLPHQNHATVSRPPARGGYLSGSGAPSWSVMRRTTTTPPAAWA
jgi:3-(3-hydroxy-phenyl)propionate hydroxylase